MIINIWPEILQNKETWQPHLPVRMDPVDTYNTGNSKNIHTIISFLLFSAGLSYQSEIAFRDGCERLSIQSTM